jgi:hypothetical protein
MHLLDLLSDPDDDYDSFLEISIAIDRCFDSYCDCDPWTSIEIWIVSSLDLV